MLRRQPKELAPFCCPRAGDRKEARGAADAQWRSRQPV